MILKGDESLYSVVVIDDNRIAVEAIVRSTDWDLCGCQVAGSAYDGVAGLRLIEEVQPDIVVIDIQMPGFNGLEVIGKMREQKKNIQFIIISGYTVIDIVSIAHTLNIAICDSCSIRLDQTYTDIGFCIIII